MEERRLEKKEVSKVDLGRPIFGVWILSEPEKFADQKSHIEDGCISEERLLGERGSYLIHQLSKSIYKLSSLLKRSRYLKVQKKRRKCENRK